MKISHLIASLAKRENLTDKQSSTIIDLIFDGFTETLKQGGRVEIMGFGAFTVRHYGEYRGRNPKTGSSIDIKEKRSAFFKVGNDLKERVNGT
ncbi:MAG: integration host factor subunit beta [Deltaproteobacteria bacterium HGW-Deltaproteobacteria-19]|jgi:integration host factor subunit beta|nr:MAG: integration host factor subunit beta [Deltaproteobacteria bacterium HGW-Deltaproteobacteria-19]